MRARRCETIKEKKEKYIDSIGGKKNPQRRWEQQTKYRRLVNEKKKNISLEIKAGDTHSHASLYKLQPGKDEKKIDEG